MSTEKESYSAIKQIIRYLVSLGFPESLIRTNVRTGQGRVVDLVLYKNIDQAFLAVEIKSSQMLPPKDEIQLRFDPSVRQLQLNAKEIGAPYFLLTNGQEYYWFIADTSGRPKLLEELPLPEDLSLVSRLINTKENLVSLLKSLNDFIRSTDIGERVDIPSLLLYALLVEEGKTDNDVAFFMQQSNLWEPGFFLDFRQSFHRHPARIVDESIYILGKIKLRDFFPRDLISAIDEVFLRESAFRNREYRIQRWLADFMVRLSQIHSDSSVLDFSCGSGEILAAVKMAIPSNNVSIKGIGRNTNTARWAQLQQYILGDEISNISLGDPLILSSESNNITHTIFVPPFNAKVNRAQYSELFEYGNRHAEDLYIEQAIKLFTKGNERIVTLVPENLLTAGSRRFIREYLIQNARIRAIISLDAGSTLPFSRIRTSILVLDKNNQQEPYTIFLGRLGSITQKDTFNSHEIPEVAKILRLYGSWSIEDQLFLDENACAVNSEQINTDNLSVNRYFPIEVEYDISLESLPYPKRSLAIVSKFIGRGKPIRLDDTGKIPVIGPATIRKLMIDTTAIRTTTKENIPNNPLLIREGDVLVNNIGTYLGQAAVANSFIENANASQHVVVIKPDQSQVDPDYLAIVLNSDFVKAQIASKATGTLMPALTINSLREIKVPIPPLDIQKEIVDVVNRARMKLEQAQQSASRLEANFNQIVSNPFRSGGK